MSKSQNKVAQNNRRQSKALVAHNTKKVSAPLSKGNVVRGNKPIIRQKGRRVLVKHREYIMDFESFTEHHMLKYELNPGLAVVFPWLSGLALNYESYRFLKVTFCVETELSANTNGYMAAAVDYDAADPFPLTKQQMMNNQTCIRAPCWEGLRLELSASDMNKLGPQKFVRYGAVTGDIKTYDSGNVYVSVVTPDGAINSAAEIYVEYEVELITPQLRPNEASFMRCKGFHTDTATKAAPWTGVTITGGETVDMLTGVANSVGMMFRNMGSFLYTLQTIGVGESAYTPTGSNSVVTLMPGSISSSGTKRQNTYMIETLADNLARYNGGLNSGTLANIAISLSAWTSISSLYATISRFRSEQRSGAFTDHVVFEDPDNNFVFRVRVIEPATPSALAELDFYRKQYQNTPL